LDFEEAFDRIKWRFLFKALENLSFFFNGLNEPLPNIGWLPLQSNLMGSLTTLLCFKNLLNKVALLHSTSSFLLLMFWVILWTI
jgi:hypothetical protein